jgi:HEPN domain-containing protein
MSLEKSREEAQRWLDQARADLRAAEASLAAGSFEWACFQAQQAGEKGAKAFWFYNGQDPWGHSITRLLQDYPEPVGQAFLLDFTQQAKALDKLYIPTRYPNGLPGSIPADVFTESEARAAIETARQFVDALAEQMPG